MNMESDLTSWRSPSETPETSWDQQKQANIPAGMFPQPRGNRLSPEDRAKIMMEKKRHFQKRESNIKETFTEEATKDYFNTSETEPRKNFLQL